MNVVYICLAVGLMIAICSTAEDHEASEIESQNATIYRLNTTLDIINYKIKLTPYLESYGNDKEAGTFDGEVIITFKSTGFKTSEVTLHMHRSLNITSKSLNGDRDGAVDLSDISYDKENEFYTMYLAEPLDNFDVYKLKFGFTGLLFRNMQGFYLSTYQDGSSEVLIATTQFEPTHARKAFPCFDEPHLKATFDIIIIHSPDYKSISNMEQKSSGPATARSAPDGWIKDVYKQTPKMSTYLVAFIVSKFETVGPINEKFNVWARPNAISQGQYSYEVGTKVLQKLNEYLGYNYNSMHDSGMKVDMAGLPDFSAGAMENWGLITFREVALLYDEHETTLSAKQKILTVVTHELAHQWFGDLVTCEWWNNIWLNEGFATYFEYFAGSLVEPTWELPEQFVLERLHVALAEDAIDISKPLSNPDVNSKASIDASFSTITYSKGASVIRMMEHMVGSDVFKESLQDYLKIYEFKSVIPDHLFDVVQGKVSPYIDLDINVIMKSWTEQPGYPVVQVKLVDGNIQFWQTRFLLQTLTKQNESIHWYIPLTYTTKSDENGWNSTMTRLMFRPEIMMQEIDGLADDDWIILNINATGYYRVHYDDILFERIVKALKEEHHSGIPPLNRAQIVDDTLNLARSDQKYIKYDKALGLLDYIEHDDSYYVWNSAFKALNFIRMHMATKRQYDLFCSYVLNLMNKIYHSLGFDARPSDSHVDILFRRQVLNWACFLEHEDCVAKAKNEFQKWRDDPTYRVPINMRSLVYCTAIRHGTKEDWDALYNKFKTGNVATEKMVILSSLGCSKDPDIMKQYLEYSLNHTEIRQQDAATVFSSVINGNQENVIIGFDFLLEHSDHIPQAYGALNALGELLSELAGTLKTREAIDELEKFIIDTNLQYGIEQAVVAIVSAHADVKWIEDNAEEIAAYFERNINSGPVLYASILLCTLSALIIWVIRRN